jgi:pyrroloquinoline quinone (PQQ) biosynthesis protein C
MNPFFLDLVIESDEARRSFETNPAILDAISHGMSASRYRQLLLELYHVVWHFNPICAAAASRLPDTHRDIRYFLYDHMHEESGHEQWVIADLAAIGTPRKDIDVHQPSIHTLTLTAYNYWAADRRHPAAVLGMMYALEVIASVYGGPFSSSIKEALLLEDDRGTSFLSSHATMDVEHMVHLKEVLNTVADDTTRAAVVESTKVNFHHITRVFQAL